MPRINAIAELERIGWPFEPSSGDEIRTNCPFHDDQRASCSLNVQKELFKCQAEGACGASGDVVTFLARALKTERAVVWADLNARYDLESVKIIDPDYVERVHAAIDKAGPLLTGLRERGITDEIIRKHRLGYDKGRITIPVKNAHGLYVNVRKYMPGAPASQKMRNTRGRSEPRLYPVEQLKFSSVMICGGELKALVAAEQLNPHGVGALTVTAAEGTWKPQFTESLRGKTVYVCMDVDEHGTKATQKIANALREAAERVCSVTLPLDSDAYPHGDINDFVAREHGNLYELLGTAEEVHAREETLTETPRNEEPKRVDFSQTSNADNVGHRLEFEGVVTASLDTPFSVPKTIHVKCNQDQECCMRCRVVSHGHEFEVSAESPSVLKMIGVSDSQLEIAAREVAGIPKTCRASEIAVTAHRNAEDVRVSPVLCVENRDTERTLQPAACIDCDVELNNTYKFTGTMWPSPRNQQSTMLISSCTPTLDALSRYEPRDLDSLRVFQPEEWTIESIQEKLDELYEDFESNVTRIYLRRDLHVFVDLAYHSPLLLKFDAETVKGWVEVLVVGDTSQGKTKVSKALHEFYGLGERIDCKNATLAGLVGGLQQLGTEWYVTWGAFPSQDKRLLILEELKGLHVNVISRLTDMRSSGIAELTKIRKRRTHSRTRIVAVSNVRPDGRTVSSYSYGVESVLDLVGSPEDIRRFDAAIVVSSSDVDPAALNATINDPPARLHVHSRELCRELILWTWTRTEDQVFFDEETRETVSREAARMAETYAESIPLVDRGSMREKLARLSASVACRTFSATEDHESVKIRPCHAKYVVRLLERVYSSPSFSYDTFSEMSRISTELRDRDQIKAYLESLPFPEELQSQMLVANSIELNDLSDWTGYDRQATQELLSLLVRKRALRRDGRGYVKNEEFSEWLRSVKLVANRPSHVPAKDF